jgi:hypothetical protein
MAQAIAIKIGSRWIAVVDYGQRSIGRSGCWCEDALGGWGVGSIPLEAVDQCAKPRTYRTRHAALEAIADTVQYA